MLPLFGGQVFFVATVLGHMQLVHPPPFGAVNNPHRTDPPDPYLQYPYDCCGPLARWEYPCRGYLRLLGTPQGASVASWQAGSVQAWNISGVGNHYGGSCQVGFSVDQGKSFQVATSYEGNCPHRNGGNDADGQNFDFTVPADMPLGEAVFAWTWFNREGEFNMNCAAVTISDGQGKESAMGIPGEVSVATMAASGRDKVPGGAAHSYTSERRVSTCIKPLARRSLHPHKHLAHRHLHGYNLRTRNPQMPYHERPAMLVANTGTGCLTPKTTAEVKFPHPGPDVVVGDGEYGLEHPSPAEACGF